MKQIEIAIANCPTIAIANLLENAAPQTCAALWEALRVPYEVPVTHSIFAGREVNLPLPKENWVFNGWDLAGENLTVFPQPGDVLWHYFPPHSEVDVYDEAYNISVVYGPETRMFLPSGWVSHTVFARIVSGLDDFAEICRRMRREGIRQARVSRR